MEIIFTGTLATELSSKDNDFRPIWFLAPFKRAKNLLLNLMTVLIENVLKGTDCDTFSARLLSA